jgi:hypothetical protein
MKAIHDARRSMLALRQLIEAHELVLQALALGLPVPDTSEEISHARLAVGYAREVVHALEVAA